MLAVDARALPSALTLDLPGMGYGIVASRTANPLQSRLRSLMNHVAFGIGLYVAAVLVARWL